MDVPQESCPNCLSNQPVTANICGVCKYPLIDPGKFARLTSWIFRYRVWFVALGVLVIWSSFWRAPYNPQYWVKRALFRPTALCADGVYSFAKGASGRCSSHGGVSRTYGP